MRAPRLLRTTPFRLTLLFLALFAAAACAFLAYIYFATAGEVTAHADAQVSREMRSLEAVYQRGGAMALNQAVVERSTADKALLYLLMDKNGAPISGSIGQSPVKDQGADHAWASFVLTQTDADGAVVRRPARGLQERMPDGELMFVGADVGEAEAYVVKILRALWGAGALVILLGLAGGVLVSRDVSRKITRLHRRYRRGPRPAICAPAPRCAAPAMNIDELAMGLNDMLDRLERSIGGLRHAGDAIAHDLRSPLTRLRARLEAAMIEADAGRADPKARPASGAGGRRRRAAHLRRRAGHRPAGSRRRCARPGAVRSRGPGRRHGRAL